MPIMEAEAELLSGGFGCGDAEEFCCDHLVVEEGFRFVPAVIVSSLISARRCGLEEVCDG